MDKTLTNSYLDYHFEEESNAHIWGKQIESKSIVTAREHSVFE